jgi:hypothetical protein
VVVVVEVVETKIIYNQDIEKKTITNILNTYIKRIIRIEWI